MELTERTKTILAAVAAVFSIPTAYSAGIYFAMGDLALLLDATFLVQENLRFGFFLITLSLLAAYLFPIARYFLTLPSDKDGTEPRSKPWRRPASLFCAGLVIVLPLGVAMTSFLDLRLLSSFFLTTTFIIVCFLFVYELQSREPRQGGAPTMHEYLLIHMRKSLSMGGYLSDFALLRFNILIIVAISANFGYHRTIALAIGPQVCISLDSENTVVSMVGKTSDGFIAAKMGTEDFYSITLPSGTAILNDNAFSLISSQSVTRISLEC